MIRSNAHTHTTFCDGKNTAKEMVLAALDKGFTCLGFSGHCETPCDKEYTYSSDVMTAYRAEIRRLQEKYRGQIDVVLGLEWDYYGILEREEYRYIIGSAHYIKSPLTEDYYTIDYTPEYMELCIQEGFQGDVLAMVKAYYESIADMAESYKPDIIGHFDLIRKLNKNNRFFDEESPIYKRIALDSLERVVRAGPVIEINTGAMYKGYRSDPYPAEFLIRHVKEMGGKMIISSDSHDVNSIDYRFGEMEQLMRDCGFQEVQVLTSEGIKGQLL